LALPMATHLGNTVSRSPAARASSDLSFFTPVFYGGLYRLLRLQGERCIWRDTKLLGTGET